MPKKKTLEEFLAQAKAVHGDKFDYSQVTEYVNGTTPVTIICKACGQPFPQTPKLHLLGHGCVHCANNKPLTTDEFIRRAKDVWGDRYTYDKTVYTTNKAKVIVTCPKHGDFKAIAYDFLQGHGCYDCGVDTVTMKRRTSQEDFIAKCKAVHGEKYDYSQTVYQGKRKRVTIICREHGPFKQWPNNHLNGEGCKWCKRDMQKDLFSMGRDEFIIKARAVHGDRYDYSKVAYVNNKTNVTVICPDHGPFEVMPQDHINKGNGCPICQTSKGETAIHVWLDAHGIKHEWHKPIHTPMAIGKRKKFVADFYIVSLNLIIEYNGEQHYKAKKEWGGEKQLQWQQARDAALRRYCEEKKIRLLEIPYTDFDRIEEILENEL